MNDNTVLRIKVPAHLYESVKEQLTLSEAKKGKHNLGAGMEIVKEKKMKAPKDGMTKMEEVEQVQETEQVEEGVMDMLRAASDKIFYNPAVVDAPKDVVKACIEDANSQKKSNPKVDRDNLIVNCLKSKGAAFKASQTTGIAEKKDRSMEDLKKAKDMLEMKIKKMEGADGEETIKEGEDKTNPALDEKKYPYIDKNGEDRGDEMAALFPSVFADLKSNANIYAGLVIHLLFHLVYGTGETDLMKMYKNKILKAKK